MQPIWLYVLSAAILLAVAVRIEKHLATPPAIRARNRLRKVFSKPIEVVYDRYPSGYVRIRFYRPGARMPRRCVLEATVDDPLSKPRQEGLAIINCDYGYHDDIVTYLRQKHGLTNSGHAKMMKSKTATVNVDTAFWMLVVPNSKFNQPG